MPSGHDSNPVLPLMNLPRIAYRKSIKPSQIIPPSRLPGLTSPPPRYHLLATTLAYLTPCPGLDCALCSALAFALWPC